MKFYYTDLFIRVNHLNIQIIYDGNKSSCVISKWNNWIYIWIRYREQDDAFYSNDVELHYVFNDKDIDREEDALND